MVGDVQRENVDRSRHEESDDSEQQVCRPDDGVDRPGHSYRCQAGDQEGCPDQEVCEVMQRIDHEDTQQEAARVGSEPDAAGDREAEQPDQQINCTEDVGAHITIGLLAMPGHVKLAGKG